MHYQIDTNEILVELDRSSIVDISIGDEIKTSVVDGTYKWKEQDAQFVESNPDARIFLRFAKSEDLFTGKGLVVVPEEVF
jgi:hypothetical protein